MSVSALIARECANMAEMLIGKNARYGNSALDPVRLFSKADPAEQLRVRIDDKLSRIARGNGNEGEDVIADLIGYLILLRIATKLGAPEEPAAEAFREGVQTREMLEALQ